MLYFLTWSHDSDLMCLLGVNGVSEKHLLLILFHGGSSCRARLKSKWAQSGTTAIKCVCESAQDLQPRWDAWCAQWLAVPSLWFLLLRASTVFTPIPGNLLRTALLSLPQCQYSHTHTYTLYTPAADGPQTNYLLTIRTSFYFYSRSVCGRQIFFYCSHSPDAKARVLIRIIKYNM